MGTLTSSSVLTGDLASMAQVLIMVGPSREFAAGVAALAAQANAATPAMLDIIKARWPEWTVIE